MTKMFHNAAPNMISSVLRKTNIYFQINNPKKGKTLYTYFGDAKKQNLG